MSRRLLGFAVNVVNRMLVKRPAVVAVQDVIETRGVSESENTISRHNISVMLRMRS